VFEREKTFHVLDRAAIMISLQAVPERNVTSPGRRNKPIAWNSLHNLSQPHRTPSGSQNLPFFVSGFTVVISGKIVTRLFHN
jgi:hypothetical protein